MVISTGFKVSGTFVVISIPFLPRGSWLFLVHGVPSCSWTGYKSFGPHLKLSSLIWFFHSSSHGHLHHSSVILGSSLILRRFRSLSCHTVVQNCKESGVSTGPLAHPFARSLAPLTHSPAPHCSLRSFICLLAHSRACGKMSDSLSKNNLVLSHSASSRDTYLTSDHVTYDMEPRDI